MERIGIVRSLSIAHWHSASRYLSSYLLRHFARSFDVHELQIVQASIGPEFLHQLLVRPFIRDGTVLKDNDSIGATDRRKPVCDNKHGSSSHKILERRLHQRL